MKKKVYREKHYGLEEVKPVEAKEKSKKKKSDK